ncbi:MAG: sigma 54-interacting transcriptional regulator [Firmicutes bacterium]|nr:sigma 54-interacting transcriptional regulator [Bacillota bacterium]
MKTQNNRLILDKIMDKLIDSMPYTVMVDSSGNIVKLSRNYASYLGVDAEESVGKYITDVIPSSGLPRVLKTKQDTIGEMFVLKNGEQIVVSRYAIMDGDQLIGAISTTILDSLKYIDELHQQIESYREEIRELRYLQRYQDNLVGESEVMRHLKHDLARIATTDVGVLITGETGTGKEVVANSIQHLSPRHNQPYVKINCAAIPSELMESELFGYEAGAFSGAAKNGKPGKFELADHGTILLDEIGEMSLPLQAKLLRVIQEQEIERVGGTRPIKIDVRILCSTNRNLEDLIAKGKFRQDLYYRINVVEIAIPPLRHRKDDIELLCQRLIQEINVQDKTRIEGIASAVITAFRSYDWPGNVRELKHVLERAAIIARSGWLETEHFGFFLRKLDGAANPFAEATLRESDAGLLHRQEKASILEALDLFGGNKKKAAEYLGISRSTLYEKIRQYKITD